MKSIAASIYREHRNVMSTSSVGSQASVGFHGAVVGMDEAVDNVMRDLTNHINNIQLCLRHIAVIADQDADYASELKLSWAVDEDLLQMRFLSDDLRGICLDLITVPETAAEKVLARKFKIDRKEHERKAIIQHNEKVKTDRAAYKLALKAERMEVIDEEEKI